MSGRINVDDSSFQTYKMTPDAPKNVDLENDAIKGVFSSTPLIKLFFSRFNINLLQEGLKSMVFKKSCGKYVIGNQSEDELLMIMRAIFLEHGNHIGFGEKKQVLELNSKVLLYSVPRIISSIEQYYLYLKDISEGPSYWDRNGKATSIKGERSLENTRWV